MRVPATARPQEAPPAHELVLFFTRFPYPTETFLQREVTAFRALGVRLRLVSLWGGATEFDGMPVERRLSLCLTQEVHYLSDLR